MMQSLYRRRWYHRWSEYNYLTREEKNYIDAWAYATLAVLFLLGALLQYHLKISNFDYDSLRRRQQLTREYSELMEPIVELFGAQVAPDVKLSPDLVEQKVAAGVQQYQQLKWDAQWIEELMSSQMKPAVALEMLLHAQELLRQVDPDAADYHLYRLTALNTVLGVFQQHHSPLEIWVAARVDAEVPDPGNVFAAWFIFELLLAAVVVLAICSVHCWRKLPSKDGHAHASA